jgi:hypothetical protein
MEDDPVWMLIVPTSQTVEIAYLDEINPAKTDPTPAKKTPAASSGGQVTLSKEAIVIVDPAMYEVDVREKLVAAVADAPELRGAWIEVSAILLREDREGDDPKFIFQPMLDTDEQKTQQPAAEALIKSLVGGEKSNYEIAKPKLRPVGQLMGQLQDQVERVAGLEGVLITYGTFRPGPDVSAPVLAFRGRVVRVEQQALVLQVFENFVEGRDACWQPQDDGIAGGAEKLVSVEPSDFAASWFFSHGMESYRDGQYEVAHEYFRRANVEIEGSSSYQYWMAVCELEMDQADRAAGRLEPILWRVRRSSRGGEYGAILSSLEKCQGDVRRELMHVELDVLKRLPDPDRD